MRCHTGQKTGISQEEKRTENLNYQAIGNFLKLNLSFWNTQKAAEIKQFRKKVVFCWLLGVLANDLSPNVPTIIIILELLSYIKSKVR